jgi:DNA-binding transcriptional LysR family regulator
MRLGYDTGTTPDKWARAWRERRRETLELVPIVGAGAGEAGLRDGSLDMCLVRLPLPSTAGLHRVRLYDEAPVVVVPRDHFVTAAETVTTSDLVDEQLVLTHPSGWTPAAAQLAWSEMSWQEAIEVVASGGGIAIMPMSVARLYARKDVASRPVTDLDPTTIALAWLVERDDEVTQAFVGVVKGRTTNSSR